VREIPADLSGKNQYTVFDFGPLLSSGALPHGLFWLKIQAWDPVNKVPLGSPAPVVQNWPMAGRRHRHREQSYMQQSQPAQQDGSADERLILLSDLGLQMDARTNVEAEYGKYATSARGVFAAGTFEPGSGQQLALGRCILVIGDRLAIVQGHQPLELRRLRRRGGRYRCRSSRVRDFLADRGPHRAVFGIRKRRKNAAIDHHPVVIEIAGAHPVGHADFGTIKLFVAGRLVDHGKNAAAEFGQQRYLQIAVLEHMGLEGAIDDGVGVERPVD